MTARAWMLRAVAASAAVVLAPTTARTSCNAIPAPGADFVSTVGRVSRPFASPGDLVVVRRDERVFAREATANDVRLRFEPRDAPPVEVTTVTALAPASGTGCEPTDCDDTACTCLVFAWPDTDALAAPHGDGLPLAGPVTIDVVRGTETVARIDGLREGEGTPHSLFPRFVALPRPNAFEKLLGAGGATLLAAVGGGDHVLVPFDFQAVRPGARPPLRVSSQVPLVEVRVPALGALGDVRLEAFSPEGRRLPSVVRRAGDDAVIGLADSRLSILRASAGAAALPAVAPGGPLVIGSVTGEADPRKRMEAPTMMLGATTAVYENNECNGFATEDSCVDIDGDGDANDRFLRALDLTRPGAEPTTIDRVEGGTFTGDPAATARWCPYVAAFGITSGLPPYGLYRFTATDALVEWSIYETYCFDLNADQFSAQRLRYGAFDLGRDAPIPLPPASVHLEVAGSHLLFSAQPNPGIFTGSPHLLHFYDAAAAAPDALGYFSAGSSPAFATTVQDPPRYWGFHTFGRTVESPTDYAMNGRHIAFVVDEVDQGEDLDHDGFRSTAVLLFDTVTQSLTPVQTNLAFGGRLRMSDRWLAVEAELTPGGFNWIEVFDLANPERAPTIICGGAGHSAILPAVISDDIIPCMLDNSGSPDPFFDFGTSYPLHVFLPQLADGPREVDVDMRVASPWDVHVSGRRLAVGLDERLNNADLDGNGRVGGGAFAAFTEGPLVVHLFDIDRLALVNLGRDVLVSRDPLLQFRDDGLVAVSATELFTPAAEEKRIGLTFFELPPPPDHDRCPGARAITALPFHDVADTRFAATAADEPISACSSVDVCEAYRGVGSVWYSFTPVADGEVVFDTAGSAFRTLVTVFAGACDGGVQVGCASGATLASGHARAQVRVTAGEASRIQIAGLDCQGRGRLVLDVSEAPVVTTTTLPQSLCIADDECPGTCPPRRCRAGTCVAELLDAEGAAACQVAAARLPGSCDGASAIARKFERRRLRAEHLLERAAAARPRRRRVLLARAERQLQRIVAAAMRLEAHDRIDQACRADVVRLATELAGMVEDIEP